MKILNFCPAAIVTGQGSLAYLKELEGRRVLVVCGGSSMERAGVLDRVQSYLEEGGREVAFSGGSGRIPPAQQIDEGVALMRQFQPDTVVAVGGGSSMDAAKAMMLFYEFPELNLDVIGKVPFPKVRKLKLVAIPSTSGTASEVTRTSVVTDPDQAAEDPGDRPDPQAGCRYSGRGSPHDHAGSHRCGNGNGRHGPCHRVLYPPRSG